MNKEAIVKLLKKYQEFKKTKEYDEQYKWDDIERLNGIFSDFNNDNLLDKINLSKSTNLAPHLLQQTGMFTYLAEKKTDQFKELLNGLFDEKKLIDNRINAFMTGVEGVLKDSEWRTKKPGIETTVFFLFLKNPKKYLLFTKLKPYNNFVKKMGLNPNLSDTSNRGKQYAEWLNFCNNELTPLMDKVSNKKNDLLDCQDFIYCLSEYEYGWDFGDKGTDSLNQKFSVLLFKYSEDIWGNISEIKKRFQDKKFDTQTSPLISYNGLSPRENDTIILLSNESRKILFLTKVRDTKTPHGKFDYYHPLFLDNPLDFKEISSDEPYIFFKPTDKNPNTRTVLFSLSEMVDNFVLIRDKILEKNPNQRKEIEKYFPSTEHPKLISDSGISSFLSKNIILYGPPGTGKTFITPTKAVNIIDSPESEEIKSSLNNYSNNEIKEKILEKLEEKGLNPKEKPIVFKGYIQFRFWDHQHSSHQGCHFEFNSGKKYSFGFDCEYSEKDTHYNSLIKLDQFITSKMKTINGKFPNVKISRIGKPWFRLEDKKYDSLDEAITHFVEFIQFMLPLLAESGIMGEFSK